MNDKEAVAKVPNGRVKRTPIGTRNVLTVTGKDPSYEYRVINDSGDRVPMFLEAGYELDSKDNVMVGDKRVGVASSVGSTNRISVGQGVSGVVVKIKKEWYAEDQAKKQTKITETENSTKQSALADSYGKLEISQG